MTAYAGLLRAVNVAGRNTVSMADLRALLERRGMKDVRTLLQSGNVVFRTERRPLADLERSLETAAKKALRLETQFFVRTAEDWDAVVAANPFPKEAKSDPGHLLVVFLKDEPDSASVDALQRAIQGRERVRAKGRQAYVVYPDGVGRSRLTAAMLERYLGSRGTGRNWNTVVKLGEMMKEDR